MGATPASLGSGWRRWFTPVWRGWERRWPRTKTSGGAESPGKAEEEGGPAERSRRASEPPPLEQGRSAGGAPDERYESAGARWCEVVALEEEGRGRSEEAAGLPEAEIQERGPES